jgi:hypothetical protein
MSDTPGPAGAPPLLTAVVRAGGGGAIAEPLLSLAAQTTQDFDVVVLVEPAGDGALGDVEDLVARFAPDFSARVRVVMRGDAAPGGLAAGAREARSAYIAVVDAGDVVFAHWAEAFATAAPGNDGRVLRSLVATQEVDVSTVGGRIAYTSTDRPRCLRPSAFDVLGHIDAAPEPIFGLALPRRVVAGRSLPSVPADPDLEDWAIVLAAALDGGVAETGEVTYLRRLVAGAPGTGGGTGDRRRDDTRRSVVAELDRRPLTLPAGTLQILRDHALEAATLRAVVDGLRADLDQAREDAGRQATARVEAEGQVEEIRASASWRLSAPVRMAGRLAREVRDRR